MGRGSGTVGRMVASRNRDPRFKSSHRRNFYIEHIYCKLLKKRPGLANFKKQIYKNEWTIHPLRLGHRDRGHGDGHRLPVDVRRGVEHDEDGRLRHDCKRRREVVPENRFEADRHRRRWASRLLLRQWAGIYLLQYQASPTSMIGKATYELLTISFIYNC